MVCGVIRRLLIQAETTASVAANRSCVLTIFHKEFKNSPCYFMSATSQ